MLFLTVNLLVAKFPLYHVPPTRACIFDVFADQNGRIPAVGSVIVAIIWKQPFLRSSAIVYDLRSAIVCDHMETSLNFDIEIYYSHTVLS